MFPYVKYVFKIFIAYSLYYTGILTFIKNRKLKNKIVVLMYHRILPEKEQKRCFSTPGIIVQPSTFSNQVKFLKKNFNVLAIDSFTDILKSKKSICGYNCIISFDDGWQDNYTYAFPILKQLEANAVIFLPIDFIGNQNTFWQEKLANLIDHYLLKNHANNLADLGDYKFGELWSNRNQQRKNNILRYISTLKNKPYSIVEKMISDISGALGVPDSFSYETTLDRYLTWEQVYKMASEGINFGSHAISHRLLTTLPREEAFKELNDSRLILESKLKVPIKSVAYPNGNYSEEIISAAIKSGYEVGFTTKAIKDHYSPGDDPYSIKRINIDEQATGSSAMFLCRLLQLF